MSRPRGGSLAVRQRRSVECRKCLNCFRASEAGQMLRFNYLCGDCHGNGYRLELFTDGVVTPRRWNVRLTRGGVIVR